jgi:hypothetical protein
MIRSQWKRLAFRRDTSTGQSSHRRSLTKLSPGCEALDSRQLLSTGATAATIAILAPPATAVANAAAILESDSPRAFAEFQATLAREASHSHVTQAEGAAVAQDLATIDQAINDAGLTQDAAKGEANVTQNWVDNAFTYRPGGLATVDWFLEQTLKNVPAVSTPSTTGGSITPLAQLMADVKTVTKAAKIAPSLQSALEHSLRILMRDLGPSPNTNLGPGATDRDPLPVYYDAQIINFIK